MRTSAPRASLELSSTLGAWPEPGGVCPPQASFMSAVRPCAPPPPPTSALGARYDDARDVIELSETRDRTDSLRLEPVSPPTLAPPLPAMTSRSSSNVGRRGPSCGVRRPDRYEAGVAVAERSKRRR